MSTPIFSIGSGGTDLTSNFNDRLISLSVTDAEGFASDAVNIVLDDRDGSMEIPPKGKVLDVSLGYVETGVVSMGQFTVDEVEVSGFPRQMTIRARSADLRQTLKQPRTGQWEEKPLKTILDDVAQRNGLEGAELSDGFQSYSYQYLPQTEESDLHLVTRLAQQHDATAKVAGGKLLFAEKGSGVAPSGRTLGSATITLPLLIDYTCQLKDRPAHKESEATWWDRKKVERVIQKKGTATQQTDQAVDAIFRYRHSLPDETQAQTRADSSQASMDRDTQTLSMTVLGDPRYGAEMLVTVVGVRQGVDGQWRVKTATHNLDSSGFVTTLDCELPGASSSGSSSSGSSSSGSTGGSGVTPSGGDGVVGTTLYDGF